MELSLEPGVTGSDDGDDILEDVTNNVVGPALLGIDESEILNHVVGDAGAALDGVEDSEILNHVVGAAEDTL